MPSSPTAEPPEVARAVFGSALPAAEAYAEVLAGAGVERGLVGPGEAARIWDRHLLNSAVLAELVPALPARTGPARTGPARTVLVDIGSGAGLPGLVLAMVLPEVSVVLVEPMERRTTFLIECIDRLGLTNVEVRRGRAEDLEGEISADVVTARAVARLDRLAVLAAGVARPGGLVLAVKGARARQELDEAMPVLRRLGAGAIEVVRAGVGVVAQPATVVRFVTSSAPHSAVARR
jgi:16S rRNA (guanine527-N7)-methyltransferase